MILLDSQQILAAVQRSLRAHVLPELQDDFARVQVLAALRALDEINDRFEQGDPCERMTEATLRGAREIAKSVRDESPAFAEQLEAELAALPEGGNAREQQRALGEALWSLVSGNDDPAAARLLALLHDQAIASATADGVYICPEAIASLT